MNQVSGSTATVAALTGWEVVIANVGDSCAYLDTGVEVILVRGPRLPWNASRTKAVLRLRTKSWASNSCLLLIPRFWFLRNTLPGQAGLRTTTHCLQLSGLNCRQLWSYLLLIPLCLSLSHLLDVNEQKCPLSR